MNECFYTQSPPSWPQSRSGTVSPPPLSLGLPSCRSWAGDTSPAMPEVVGKLLAMSLVLFWSWHRHQSLKISVFRPSTSLRPFPSSQQTSLRMRSPSCWGGSVLGCTRSSSLCSSCCRTTCWRRSRPVVSPHLPLPRVVLSQVRLQDPLVQCDPTRDPLRRLRPGHLQRSERVFSINDFITHNLTLISNLQYRIVYMKELYIKASFRNLPLLLLCLIYLNINKLFLLYI